MHLTVTTQEIPYHSDSDVSSPTPVWWEMFDTWRLPLALRTGSEGMRDGLYGSINGEDRTGWLPKYPGEEQARYDIRRKATTLFPGFDDTVERLTSKPFVRPVTMEGDLPERLAELESDCDREGSTLTQFAARVMGAALTTGMTHVLVDFPATGGELDRASELRSGVNPYFVHIPAEALFAWRWGRTSAGTRYLRQIRYREHAEVETGEWGVSTIDRIHVYDFVTAEDEGPGLHTTFALDQKAARWVQEGEPQPTSFVGVPLVTYYTSYLRPMECSVPLQGVADLNLAHYQVSSEHRNVLTACGVAMLSRVGVSKAEADEGVAISPMSVLTSTNKDARIEWVEHTGAGVSAIERYLTQTEERMEALGMAPLQRQATRTLATTRMMDESKSETQAQAWVRDLEEVFTRCYRIAGEWVREDLPEDFAIRVYNEFGVLDGTAEELRELREARVAREISRETYLHEIRRRSLISEDTDIEEEMERIEAEGPDLASLQPVPGFGQGAAGEGIPDPGEPEEAENAA